MQQNRTLNEVGPRTEQAVSTYWTTRTEEALGSALDIWTAYREGAFLSSPQPFLGYFFMLEDSPASNSPVRVAEPHFKVFPEFVNASYMKRYEVFCRKRPLHSSHQIEPMDKRELTRYQQPTSRLKYFQKILWLMYPDLCNSHGKHDS
jgi:hypothetical protein